MGSVTGEADLQAGVGVGARVALAWAEVGWGRVEAGRGAAEMEEGAVGAMVAG